MKLKYIDIKGTYDSYHIYLNNSPCFNNSPSPGLDVKNGDFWDEILEILRPLIRAHCKKWRKKDPTLCCKFQNVLLDHQT